MAQWWADIKSSAYLTLEQNIVAAQVNFRSLAGGLQLFQVTVAKFILLVAFVADRLRVRDSLWNCRRGRDRMRGSRISFGDVCRH